MVTRRKRVRYASRWLQRPASDAATMATRLTAESNATTRIESDSCQAQTPIPSVNGNQSPAATLTAIFGVERARSAAYAMIATPSGRVRVTHKNQTSAVKGSGCLMAAAASSHSLRMKANQATPQMKL